MGIYYEKLIGLSSIFILILFGFIIGMGVSSWFCEQEPIPPEYLVANMEPQTQEGVLLKELSSCWGQLNTCQKSVNY